MGHVTLTTPLSGTICRRFAGTSYDSECIKYEISTFTHYEDMKGDEKCSGVVLGLGVTQGHQKHSHSIEHI